ncbi:MAG: class I SAM-dependent methyltransferase [Gemmatimonadales bacterium]|nr:class I SAM-dependent methyltransferase [Gemmatimonadales bacterium]
MLAALLPHRGPGLRFLEWGSATGVITIMADLLGFDAWGVELDSSLVDTARKLATRYESRARFVAGSFLPTGYRWQPADGDGRTGTVGSGLSAYLELGRPLEDFDVVFGYPWDGEAAMMIDLMTRYGRPGGLLLLNSVNKGIIPYRDGRPVG